MLTLYSRPGSGGFVVEVALTMAGLPYRVINVERGESPPGFAAISPLGQVPALVFPDGSAMTESAAICLLLAERHPGAGLGPGPGAPERPEFLRWMMFLATGLYPTLLEFYYPHRHTTDPDGSDRVEAASIARSDRLFGILEQALAGRQWLAGESMTIADVYLVMLAYWHPVSSRPREEWVNMTDLCRRVAAHPVVAKLNETHRFW